MSSVSRFYNAARFKIDSALMRDPYIYDPLPNPRSIRLLHLQPGSGEGDVKWNLVTVDLDGSPSYEAISYVWGPPSDRTFLKGNDGAVAVPKNLKYVLQRLRKQDQVRILWADAVCINQQDMAERGAQVSIMDEIFAEAVLVNQWLGLDPDGDAKGAFLLMEKFCQWAAEEFEKHQDNSNDLTIDDFLAQFPELQPESNDRIWKALSAILKREFFYRVWMIQEIGLAKKATIYCGDEHISFDYFLIFIHALSRAPSSHDEELRDRFFKRRVFYDLFKANDILATYLNYQYGITGDDHRAKPFLQILLEARTCKATDARDHVYALLGHPSSVLSGSRVIDPDYKKSIEEVHIELAARVIRRTHSLHALTFVCHLAEKTSESLPSWVPQFHLSEHVGFDVIQDIWKKDYRAAPEEDQSISVDESDSTLTVRGFVWNVVEKCAETDDNTTFNIKKMKEKSIRVLTEFGGFATDGSCIDEKMAEAFIASHQCLNTPWTDIEGNLLSQSERNQLDAKNLSSRRSEFDAAVKAIFGGEVSDDYHGTFLPNILKKQEDKYMDRWFDLSMNNYIYSYPILSDHRRHFSTQGRVGAGPVYTRPGDLCCLLMGCKMPVILRKVESHYLFIGTAYVHGTMRGEAWDENRELQYFNIH